MARKSSRVVGGGGAGRARRGAGTKPDMSGKLVAEPEDTEAIDLEVLKGSRCQYIAHSNEAHACVCIQWCPENVLRGAVL